jgi:HEAT repeat protein
MLRTRSFTRLLAVTALWIAGCAPQPRQPGVEVPPPPQAPKPPPPVAQPLDESLRAAALAQLLAAADSSNPTLRSEAIEALQNASPPDAIDVAIKALKDPDPFVRFAACMAVGKLRIQQARDQLLGMHDRDDSRIVQVGVRFALHRLGDIRYSHDLEAFARDPSPEVRGKTALALGLLEEPSAIAVLYPMRHDTEATVRLQVAASLWMLGDERGLEDLLGAAISGYPDDVILANLALAAPRNQTVIQHIRANLVTDYPEIDLSAARALGELGSDEGYVIAMKATRSVDPRQRFLAALALGAIGRSDAQEALGQLLQDPASSVRLATATAILELHQS